MRKILFCNNINIFAFFFQCQLKDVFATIEINIFAILLVCLFFPRHFYLKFFLFLKVKNTNATFNFPHWNQICVKADVTCRWQVSNDKDYEYRAV